MEVRKNLGYMTQAFSLYGELSDAARTSRSTRASTTWPRR